MNYSRPIDGLRGIAIIAVVLFHQRFAFIRGGFAGVDVFFVLSGYLITAILLAEYQRTGSINFANFYMRRILRLFPALLFLLLVYAVFAVIFIPNPEDHFVDIGIVFFYMANWTRALEMGRPMVLGHCWSLSIEEQFYLFWPLLMYFSVRKFGSKGLILITAAISFCTIVERGIFSGIWSSSRILNGFDTRIDTLLYGCLLGIAFHFWGEKWLPPLFTKCLPIFGWTGLFLFVFLGGSQWSGMDTYGYLLIAAFSAALVISAVGPGGGRTKQFLSNPVLVWFGKRSYSLYLWHDPFNVFLLQRKPSLIPNLLAAVLGLVMAEISYRFVERPFLKMKNNVDAVYARARDFLGFQNS